MAKILNFPECDKIQEEAGYWLVKLDMGELSMEDEAGLREWLEKDVRHQEALVELAGLWDDMDIMAQLSDLFPLSRRQPVKSGLSRNISGSRVVKTALAASLVMAVAIISFMERDLPGIDTIDNNLFESVYRTDVGEQNNINLPDGSVTQLNTDTRIKISFSDDQREISLIKGEAHFQVAKDGTRPFIVHAGNGQIRAVGTAFNVRLRDRGVEVTVSEGKVEIASAEESGDELFHFGKFTPTRYLTTLEAGQRAEYGEQAIHSVGRVEPEIISRNLSWQHGMLVFNGEALEEVVREISRYTRTEIVISDPDIRNIRIGGYFKTGETESLLTVLKDNFPIKVRRAGKNLVYLSSDKVARAKK